MKKILTPLSEGKLQELSKYMPSFDIATTHMLCSNYVLPEWFIHQHANKFDWDLLNEYQDLTEQFIEAHLDNVNNYGTWENLSRHQTLSIDFMRKYKEKIDWDEIGYNNVLSREIIQEFFEYLDIEDIKRRNIIENFMTIEELESLEIMRKIIE